MTTLTIHVLDTAHGLPAAGVEFALCRVETSEPLLRGRTNSKGRTDQPLLEGMAFCAGIYELTFDVSAYFTAMRATLSQPPFLDRIAIRFGVADPMDRYHIALLVSPWSYTTYRGS